MTVTLALESLAESIAARGGKVPEIPFAQAEERGLVIPIAPKEEYFKRIWEVSVNFDVLKKDA